MQVDVFAVEDRERRFAARHPQHAILALEDRGQRVAHPFVVVDDQDGFGLMAHWHSEAETRGIVVRRLTLLQAVR